MSEATAEASEARAEVVRDFARSELFDRTFREGMALVEETAAYLDGEGRRDSKLLSRSAALAYAGESMRLTTRLMQIASWLLVQRAVREGDMDPNDACDGRYRMGAHAICRGESLDHVEDLPEGLLLLLEQSERLYERVLHLDRRMYLEPPSQAEANPVLTQLERLQSAFRPG
jgi:regulator of CtrA degradation